MNRSKTRSGVTALIAVLLLGIGTSAHAYFFTPTEPEWAAWPWYCQAKYLVTDVGKRSQFYGKVSWETIEKAKSYLGHKVYDNLHHYCAGLAWLSRIPLAKTEQERHYRIFSARAEHLYSLNRTPKEHWLYPIMVVTMAQAMMHDEDYKAALELINDALRFASKEPQLHSIRYLVLRKSGNTEEAFDALREGVDLAGAQYAELHYFLGLEYLQRKQLELAKQHAEKAYGLGYPLPALRERLAAQGAW